MAIRGSGAEADAAYARGDWETASLLARRRLKQVPDDRAALFIAARAAARQDRDQTALTLYSRLNGSAMQPEDHFLLGRALSRNGRIEDAMKSLEAARAANPDDPATLDLLCRLYYQTDRSMAAIEVASRLARHPESEARAQLMLGLAHAELDDPAGEARALGRWLALDPEGRLALPDPLPPLKREFARSLLRTGRPEDAERILLGLLSTGIDPEASWLLSRAYLQEKRWSPAEAAREQAASFLAATPCPSEPAPRIGEARCAACHRREHEAVLASRHAFNILPPGGPARPASARNPASRPRESRGDS